MKALVILAIISAFLITGSVAEAGWHRGGSKQPPVYVGTCVATPNPVTLWENVTINGEGASPNGLLGYTWSDVKGIGGGWVTADANGNFVLSGQTFALGTTTVIFGGVAICTFETI